MPLKLIHSGDFQRVLCFVNALMYLTAFEFGDVFLVKSTETSLTVFFQLCKLIVSICSIAKLNCQNPHPNPAIRLARFIPFTDIQSSTPRLQTKPQIGLCDGGILVYIHFIS